MYIYDILIIIVMHIITSNDKHLFNNTNPLHSKLDFRKWTIVCLLQYNNFQKDNHFIYIHIPFNKVQLIIICLTYYKNYYMFTLISSEAKLKWYYRGNIYNSPGKYYLDIIVMSFLNLYSHFNFFRNYNPMMWFCCMEFG